MFSVIIPSYNRAALLETAVNSVLAQSFADFELIVVDDGSTDHTAQLITQWKSDHRFRYCYIPNGGVAAARNKGALLASADYLVFLDSDDEVTDNWLDAFAQQIKLQQPDFLQCGMRKIEQGKESIVLPALGSEAGPRGIRFNIPGSFAIRRQLFLACGMYDTQLKFGENTELFFRLKPWELKYALIDAPNFIYRPHPQGGAKNRANRVAANLYVINKHKSFFDNQKVLKQQYLQVAGVDSMVLGNTADGWRYLAQGWLANPLYPKAFLRLAIGSVPFMARRIWRHNNQ